MSICQEHQSQMLLVGGQWKCPVCLGKNRRNPTQYYNLGALNILPPVLRDYRLDNYPKTKTGNEYGFITAFRKLIHADLSALETRLLWITSPDIRLISQALASIVADRVLVNLPTRFYDLRTILAESESFSQVVTKDDSTSFVCIDNVFANNGNNFILGELLRSYLYQIVNHNGVLVIGSAQSLTSVMQFPYIRSTLSHYSNFIKEIKING